MKASSGIYIDSYILDRPTHQIIDEPVMQTLYKIENIITNQMFPEHEPSNPMPSTEHKNHELWSR